MTEHICGGRYGINAVNTIRNLTTLKCSHPEDARLFADNIGGSKAYAEALKKAGYLTAEECTLILSGLELVRYDWIEGLLKFLPFDENVYTVNERRLIEIIGVVGYRLHIGRNRNEQVVTDMKLWLRKAIRETCASLRKVMESMMQQSQENLGILMPGYTHMQRTTAVQFSHWLLSHAFALREDCLRLYDVRSRSSVLPLGSGVLAGSPLQIDRVWLAERLGFAAVSANSMQAVGDYDFIVDFIYCCAMIGLHLSRLAEDLIIYATQEFDFIRISDDFSTGNSLTPQQRSPDSVELVRGLSSNLCSLLIGSMMTIKGIPSTYNKDLEINKQYCFEAFDKVQLALSITDGIVKTMKIRMQGMEMALSADMLATDWVYYLVRKGVPFSQAHDYMEAVLAHGERMSLDIPDIPLVDLQQICPYFTFDISKVAEYTGSVEQYDVIGGTATTSVTEQLKLLGEFISGLKKLE